MTQKINKSALIIWQDSEEGVPESALLVRSWGDPTMTLQQGANEVIINKESLPELMKILKHYQSNEDFEKFQPK